MHFLSRKERSCSFFCQRVRGRGLHTTWRRTESSRPTLDRGETRHLLCRHAALRRTALMHLSRPIHSCTCGAPGIVRGKIRPLGGIEIEEGISIALVLNINRSYLDFHTIQHKPNYCMLCVGPTAMKAERLIQWLIR